MGHIASSASNWNFRRHCLQLQKIICYFPVPLLWFDTDNLFRRRGSIFQWSFRYLHYIRKILKKPTKRLAYILFRLLALLSVIYIYIFVSFYFYFFFFIYFLLKFDLLSLSFPFNSLLDSFSQLLKKQKGKETKKKEKKYFNKEDSLEF